VLDQHGSIVSWGQLPHYFSVFPAEEIAISNLRKDISSAVIFFPPCKESKTSAMATTFYSKFVTSALKQQQN